MKKKNIKYKPLSREQKDFIKSKVIKLGSYQNVVRDYRRDDLVSKFAKAYATKYYKHK